MCTESFPKYTLHHTDSISTGLLITEKWRSERINIAAPPPLPLVRSNLRTVKPGGITLTSHVSPLSQVSVTPTIWGEYDEIKERNSGCLFTSLLASAFKNVRLLHGPCGLHRELVVVVRDKQLDLRDASTRELVWLFQLYRTLLMKAWSNLKWTAWPFERKKAVASQIFLQVERTWAKKFSLIRKPDSVNLDLFCKIWTLSR